MNQELCIEMIERARQAMNNAYVPSSGFAVGACLKTEKGTLFSGCNFENASFPLSQCAEASAIGNMITAGEHKITDMVILARKIPICPPCGGCRQKVAEFSTSNTTIYLCADNEVKKILTIEELLPFQFKMIT